MVNNAQQILGNLAPSTSPLQTSRTWYGQGVIGSPFTPGYGTDTAWFYDYYYLLNSQRSTCMVKVVSGDTSGRHKQLPDNYEYSVQIFITVSG